MSDFCRTAIRAFLGLTALLWATSALAAYQGEDGEIQNFTIYINGTKSGVYTLQYKAHKKNAWTVTAQQSYVMAREGGTPRKVRLITREYWVGNQFYRLEGKIDDDGKTAAFKANRLPKAKNLTINALGKAEPVELPATAIPFSFWNMDAVATAPLVFEPMTGAPIKALRVTGKSQKVILDGKERTCTGYRVASSRGLVDIWYDEDQRMCAAHLQMEGTVLVFKPFGKAKAAEGDQQNPQ